jgi:hypothetical protein
MKRAVRIGIVADYDPRNKYHVATEQSVTHAAEALEIPTESHFMLPLTATLWVKAHVGLREND